MKFKKNPFAASACKFALILCAIFILFVVCLAFAVPNPVKPLILFLITFGIADICVVGLVIVCLIENNSEVIISEDGIESTSKISGKKYIEWSSCAFIGVYGYNYGSNGILFFSRERHLCSSQYDCLKYANKNPKSIISINYDTDVFFAVEKYAPAHLVVACRRLMNRQR